MLPLSPRIRPAMQCIPALFTRPSLFMLAKGLHVSTRLQTTLPAPPKTHYSSLRNLTAFPPFASLPAQNTRRNWCFLAEIEHISWFMRLRLDVKDRDNAPVNVYFYTPDRGGAIVEDLKTGYTLAVFYATPHLFVDGDMGVRVDANIGVKVLPCSLAELMAANDKLFSNDELFRSTCAKCGERLRKIFPRGEAPYCSQVCKQTHDGVRALEAASWFAGRNWKNDNLVGSIHIQGNDPVNLNTRVFGEEEWAMYRETLGMLPPTYKLSEKDVRLKITLFNLLRVLWRYFWGSRRGN